MDKKRLKSYSALAFQCSGKNRKIILITATSVLSAQRESTEKTGIYWFCPNLESAARPNPHCNEIPVPVFEGLPELELPGFEEDQASVLSTDSCGTAVSDVDFTLSSLPQLFFQGELNNPTRDLNLSKESSELLALRPKEKKSASAWNSHNLLQKTP